LTITSKQTTMRISINPNKFTHRNHHQHAQHNNHHEPDIAKTTGSSQSSSSRSANLATNPQTHLSDLMHPTSHTCNRCGKTYKSGPALGGHKKYCGKQINQLHIHQPKISVDSENLSVADNFANKLYIVLDGCRVH